MHLTLLVGGMIARFADETGVSGVFEYVEVKYRLKGDIDKLVK